MPETRGIVLDARGLPAPNAVVANQWQIEKGFVESPLTPGATKTLMDGSFSLADMVVLNGRFALLVYDKARQQGAIVDLPVSEREKPLIIRMRPVQTVHYSIVVAGPLIDKAIHSRLYTSSGIPVISLSSVAHGSLTLPPGQYLLKAQLAGAKTVVSSFVVRTQEVTLQPLHIELSSIAQHYGHGTPDLTAPLLTMDHKLTKIHHVQGEWMLLYFWATWCVPCVNEGIPQLIAFTNSHRSSSTFRIIAIHEKPRGEESTWQEFHDKTMRLQRERWHVTSLPFSVLYDQSSRLTSAWDVEVLPTYALIDPDGNLVPEANLKTLEQKIRE